MHRVPVFEPGMFRIVGHHALLEAGDPGVVHQHVEPPALHEDLPGHPLPIGFQAHIQGQIAGTVAQFGCDGVAELGVEVGDIDKGALRHESPGDGGAYALGRAGDQSGLVLEFGCHANTPSRS